MRIAIKKAEEIYQKYENNLKAILEALGLTLIEEELEGRLKEVYFGDSIVIKKGLPKQEKRELIAHAIGHHLMHAGNHIAMQNRVYSFGNYHERQANAFAACLLVPKGKLEGKINMPVHELAEYFDVTEKLIELRLKIFKYFENLEMENELSYIS